MVGFFGKYRGRNKMVENKIDETSTFQFRDPCVLCDLRPMGKHCVDCKFYQQDLDPEYSKVVDKHFWELA